MFSYLGPSSLSGFAGASIDFFDVPTNDAQKVSLGNHGIPKRDLTTLDAIKPSMCKGLSVRKFGTRLIEPGKTNGEKVKLSSI